MLHIGRDRNRCPDYLDWLSDMIDLYSADRYMYTDLIKYLYSVEFHYSILLDRNRCKDATAILYCKYMNEIGVDYNLETVYDRECSVLEVLIALSFRCERDIMGEPGSYEDDKWFWIMIENLGLLDYDNDSFNEDDVNYILQIWMNREFAYDGNGGIFPINRAKRDQRKLEIWDQMADYLDENYPI